MSRLEVVQIDQLVPHPGNVREDLGDLTELALSIRSVVLLQPVVAVETDEPGQYRLVAGHRRTAAAALAGMKRVPALIRTDLDDDDVLAAMLVENMQRQTLTPMEEAHALAALRARTGMTVADLGRRVGRSIAWVSMRLSLLDLTEADQQALFDGDLTVSDAQERVREDRRESRGKGRNDKADRGWDSSPWHFGKTHRLAPAAEQLCNEREHNGRRRLRETACGRCWEDLIRADERRPQGKPPPVVDDVAVERAADGDRTVRLTVAERRAAVRLLHARRINDQQIAARLGVAGRTVLRIRHALDLPAVEGLA